MNIDRVLVLCLFAGFTIKSAILGANISDAVIILGLAAAHFLYNLNIKNKEIAELKQELATIKSHQNDVDIIVSELRTNITGIKLNQGLRKA